MSLDYQCLFLVLPYTLSGELCPLECYLRHRTYLGGMTTVGDKGTPKGRLQQKLATELRPVPSVVQHQPVQ